MPPKHPKSIRREMLLYLYNRYQNDPLEMIGPGDFLEGCGWTKQELVPNIHYLHDRKLVELMFGYNPPLFAAARILAAGIDLVEHPFEFDRMFPPSLEEDSTEHSRIMYLVEHLVDEVDFAPVEGHARRNQLRDAQYLRDEAALSSDKWRWDVMLQLLDWIEAPLEDPAGSIPSIYELRKALQDMSATVKKE